MKRTIILEGRYDSSVRKVVKDIFTVIKKTYGYPVDEMVNAELPYSLEDTEEYYLEKSGISFSVEFNVMRSEQIDTYLLESFRITDEDVLEFNLIINPNLEESLYQKVFYKLQEDVRHELEHLLQHGTYRKEDRPELSDTNKRETTFKHHNKPDEIEALVQGFYRRAKIEKRPLDDVMTDDLDNEIERGNLTKKQAQKLLNTWILFAKRRLPKAIYRN